MPVERSAGAIVFHRSPEGLHYLLLRYGSGHWDFPRGRVEKGETDLEAALREIEEETGFSDVDVVPDFAEEITWFYQRSGKTVRKTAVYFLVEAFEETVTLSWEHEDFDWLPIDEAASRATYKGAKTILRKADALLTGRGGVQQKLV